uniref:U47-Sparatoxin-Hju1a_1 n=1 Tax=Heteropoda jugulans TaxID=1358901 RepID=A0A4Q8KD34_9ARAC
MKYLLGLTILIAVAHFGCAQMQCSPPRCPSGCRIEYFYNGRCPGCDCRSTVGNFRVESSATHRGVTVVAQFNILVDHALDVSAATVETEV